MKKLLLVEDSRNLADITKKQLEAYSFEVDIVTTGRQAIRKVRKNSYDAVLMDLHMPHLNGLQTTKIIRRHINNQMPIICLTGLEDYELACQQAWMNDYLKKPFSIGDIIMSLEKFGIHNDIDVKKGFVVSNEFGPLITCKTRKDAEENKRQLEEAYLNKPHAIKSKIFITEKD